MDNWIVYIVGGKLVRCENENLAFKMIFRGYLFSQKWNTDKGKGDLLENMIGHDIMVLISKNKDRAKLSLLYVTNNKNLKVKCTLRFLLHVCIIYSGCRTVESSFSAAEGCTKDN